MLQGGMKKQANTSLSVDGKSTVTTTSIVPNTWDFTVEDESQLPAIQRAMDTGEAVTIKYRQELVTFCRSDSDGDYFVTGVTR